MLLDGLAEVTVSQPRLADPVDQVLTVTADRVRLTGPGGEVSAAHGRVRPGLAEAVNEARRARGPGRAWPSARPRIWRSGPRCCR